MDQLFVLDLGRGYRSVSMLSAAALARDGGEVLIVQGGSDHVAVQEAIDRFRPAQVHAMAGTVPPQTQANVLDDPLQPQPLPHEEAQVLAWLVENALPGAKGVVLIPAHSPSWAIKGAALATRLGYLVWPVEEAAGLAYTAPAHLTVLAVGEVPGTISDALQGRQWLHLPGDRAIAQHLVGQNVLVDYLVLINSADTTPPEYAGQGLAASWIPGISLLAPLLASFRPALVIDAHSPRPDSRLIESTVRQKVHDVGMRPHYFAVLASPGAVPFIEEPNRTFSGGEDSVRDLHLRHDDDLFFDCAEGRILALTAGRASLQLLSVKHYGKLQGAHREKALLAMRPQVESSVVFAIDEAVGRVQVAPLLRRAGITPVELYGEDCSPARIAEHLGDTSLFLYGGHGHSNALSTHGSPLYAEALPSRVAPGVVYACACSTVYPKPDRSSGDGWFSHDDEVVPPAEVIGMAFVQRGALAYVGGLTVEDVLLNTAMYVVFVDHLVMKGESVGNSVRAARNHALTYAATLGQKAFNATDRYMQGLANATQQQILLGDPAFTPYGGSTAGRLPIRTENGDGEINLTLTVPDAVWARGRVPVFLNEAGRKFHRARHLETWLPVAQDVCNWGENYTVAADREGLSERGIMGGYIHLAADLPTGRVPVSLTLEEAAAVSDECLLCERSEDLQDATLRFSCYTVQFQGRRPAVRVDQTDCWAFATEETPDGLRLHWLVPTIAIDDSRRRAALLRSARFKLKHVPGAWYEGRVEVANRPAGVQGIPGALEGSRGAIPADVLLSFGRVLPPAAAEGSQRNESPRLHVIAQTLTGPGGRFACWLPAEELGAHIGQPFPIYRHCTDAALTYEPRTVTGLKPHSEHLTLPAPAPVAGTMAGVVLDKQTGRPLSGARVRVWQGEEGEESGWRGGYCGESRSDAHGRFEFSLPPGKYTVSAQTRTDYRYFPGSAGGRIYAGRRTPVLVVLEPGAVLEGAVSYTGGYLPRGGSVRLVEHQGALDKPIGQVRVRRDGRFAGLVPAFRPFAIVIEQEGYRRLVDDNGGAGYHLEPGQSMTKNFSITTSGG